MQLIKPTELLGCAEAHLEKLGLKPKVYCIYAPWLRPIVTYTARVKL
jgi:hypothetical protein